MQDKHQYVLQKRKNYLFNMQTALLLYVTIKYTVIVLCEHNDQPV